MWRVVVNGVSFSFFKLFVSSKFHFKLVVEPSRKFSILPFPIPRCYFFFVGGAGLTRLMGLQWHYTRRKDRFEGWQNRWCIFKYNEKFGVTISHGKMPGQPCTSVIFFELKLVDLRHSCCQHECICMKYFAQQDKLDIMILQYTFIYESTPDKYSNIWHISNNKPTQSCNGKVHFLFSIFAQCTKLASSHLSCLALFVY